MSQPMLALAVANDRRLNGAAVIQELRDGTIRATAAIYDSRAACLKIGRLLEAQPKWGPSKVSKLLGRARLAPTVRVRDLTDAQLDALWDLLN